MTRALDTWQSFQTELETQAESLTSQLPSNIPFDRFKNAAIAAVKQNIELLQCDPRSLFTAITQAAQDGLVPDGKEGVILPYNERVKDKWGNDVLDANNKPTWRKVARWTVMVYGIRKRARDLDGIIIDAQVVHEKDHFVWAQGDEPRLEHNINLGKRGEMIGVYAIFKREDGTILHREVMDKEQIATVRDCSKQPNGMLWNKFATEGWRKSVVRRGQKTVPCSDGLQRIFERDNELFDLEGEAHEVRKALEPPTPPAPPEPPVETETKPVTPPEPTKEPDDVEGNEGDAAPPDMLKELEDQLATASDVDTANEIYDTVTGMVEESNPSDDEKAQKLFDDAIKRIG